MTEIDDRGEPGNDRSAGDEDQPGGYPADDGGDIEDTLHPEAPLEYAIDTSPDEEPDGPPE